MKSIPKLNIEVVHTHNIDLDSCSIFTSRYDIPSDTDEENETPDDPPPVPRSLTNVVSGVISDKMADQDFNQRVSVCSTFMLELYRCLTSSLLILFVPQLCVDHVCSLSENMEGGTEFYNSALAINFITLFAFLSLYSVELHRENRLIKYLEVNVSEPNDDVDVGDKLAMLDIDKSNKIWSIDKQYQYVAYITMVVYAINIIMSGIVVNEYYLNNQTASAFLTYVLFIFTKLYSVYSIANTKPNTFYSAYLKSNVQYNDLDPTYRPLDQINPVSNL